MYVCMCVFVYVCMCVFVYVCMCMYVQVLLTDTTMRDAHQSLLATRVRTEDLVKVHARTHAHII